MRRLPRRPGRAAGLGTIPTRGALLRSPRGPDDAARREDDGSLAPVHRRGSARPRGSASGDLPGIPVDAAIEAALAAPGVDPVTRIHLDEARGSLAARRSDDRDGAEDRNLADTLFTFVMPRLQHPEVLGIERQRVILEQLAEELGAEGGDRIVREGALAVYRELRRIALLRQHCSSLVEG